jgi:hypothetical protein
VASMVSRLRVSSGLAAPVRDLRMQPFSRDLVLVGSCRPRSTAVAGLRFLEAIGERLFLKVDRSFDLKSATDAFGSLTADRGPALNDLSQSRSALQARRPKCITRP